MLDMPKREATAAQQRICLFLQGPASPLFEKISNELEMAGWRCLRINLNLGDQIFWRRKGATQYRGRLADWPLFLRRFMQEHGVTDLIMIGEERDYHKPAIQIAKELGIERYVVDMGYLRPDWVTIEREGLSSNSLFPTTREALLSAARGLDAPQMTPIYRQTFVAEAAYDLLYNLPNVFLWFLFPHYKRHALFHPLAEYAGWLRRLMREKSEKKLARAALDALVARRARFFVFPLQLQTDFQLRAHSPYHSQQDAICEVLRSFARHSAATDELIFKVHPLDNDLIHWRRAIAQMSIALGVADRVHYIDGGNLDEILQQSAGMIAVNSSAALNALRIGKPVKTLGSAIFNIQGLTDQKPLDHFWHRPDAPEAAVSDAFFRVLATSIQVRGNLSSTAGAAAAAKAIAKRLIDGTVNLPGAMGAYPTRQKPQKRNVTMVG